MIPQEWKDADFTEKATRKAFADWLEERGDWRAEEIRRLWIFHRTRDQHQIYSGGTRLNETYNTPSLRGGMEWVIFLIMGNPNLFHEVTPADWS